MDQMLLISGNQLAATCRNKDTKSCSYISAHLLAQGPFLAMFASEGKYPPEVFNPCVLVMTHDA